MSLLKLFEDIDNTFGSKKLKKGKRVRPPKVSGTIPKRKYKRSK